MIAALLAAVCGLLVLAELVWVYHVVAIFRRQRPVVSGLVRAFTFAGATGVLIAGALYLARP